MQQSHDRQNHLAWIDLEMTGLNPDTDVILEIATVVTDADLNVIAEGPVLAISAPAEILAGMDEWNQKQHRKSGLLDRVLASGETMASAERQTLEFLAAHLPPGKVPLCGNSIWQDRRFLARHMPALEKFFHYRIVDISSFKEVARRWYPDMPAFKKQEAHLALADILESVEELKHYRQHLFTRGHAGDAAPTPAP
ncbi:MAG TPA: oligoribonuclease [Fibrobacteria bacterium]|jgi:oligoribonuclease|nr:oligoribonuclease [Fibrobacteria bacterium]